MNLRRVAAKFETTQFDTFDEATSLWASKGLTGKIMPVDRFLSIFHRSTVRRQLGIAPNSTLPTSETIRNPATGEVFVVGLVRGDSTEGVAYDSVGILNECDSVGIVNRKATIGSGQDLGVLVNSVAGKHYMSIELRSSSKIRGTTEEFEAHYFLTAPLHSDLQIWDFIVLNGVSYQVATVYIDSGLRFARVIERDDPRVDIVFYKKGPTSGYNPTTGQVTDGLTAYNMSGFFESFEAKDIDNQSIFSRDMKFIIEQANIGIVPEEKDELVYQGQRYKVHTVQQDFLKKQFKLHCRV